VLKNLAGFIMLAACLHAQDRVQEAWLRHFGSGLVSGQDFATAIAVDNAGNVYVTGRSPNAPRGFDYVTVKYDATGAQLWTARYDGPGNAEDTPVAIAVDASGNVYVTGTSAGVDTEIDCATIKYNSVGIEQWAARYNRPGNLDDIATALGIDAQGNVYVGGWSLITGTEDEYGIPSSDYLLIKYNSAGAEQWVAYKEAVDFGIAEAMSIDASGNVYVTGMNSFHYFTVKYDTDGAEQWAVSSSDRANEVSDLTVDAVGNIYVTGNSLQDYATIKYDPAGVQQWVARYNVPEESTDTPSAKAVDAAGNIHVTGTSRRLVIGMSSLDYATVKYNPAGDQQWVARYESRSSRDWAAAMAIDVDGSVVVTGFSEVESSNSYNFATVKYDAAGTQVWAVQYNDGKATAIAVDKAGSIYVTGISAGDYVTIKYNTAGLEQWVARYNGPRNLVDVATDIEVDETGNVYVTGGGDAQAEGDFGPYSTIKYNSAGTQQWVARYGSFQIPPDRVPRLAVDFAGNVYVTGKATIKYDSLGIEQWVANYSDGFANAIAVDAAGYAYVTGDRLNDYFTI
jgi:uncharacterized delta-60 repeat protein